MGSYDHLLPFAKTAKNPEEEPENTPNGLPEERFGSFGSGADDITERIAIIQHDTGVPEEWAIGFASLLHWMPDTLFADGFTRDQWQQLIDDGGKFLDQWGRQAAALGWTAADVFGADPVAPNARVDAQGLVFLIQGRAVKAITAASLALRGDGTHFVSLDVAIETMRQTGMDMDRKYKETSLGGLAVNVPEC